MFSKMFHEKISACLRDIHKSLQSLCKGTKMYLLLLETCYLAPLSYLHNTLAGLQWNSLDLVQATFFSEEKEVPVKARNNSNVIRAVFFSMGRLTSRFYPITDYLLESSSTWLTPHRSVASSQFTGGECGSD